MRLYKRCACANRKACRHPFWYAFKLPALCRDDNASTYLTIGEQIGASSTAAVDARITHGPAGPVPRVGLCVRRGQRGRAAESRGGQCRVRTVGGRAEAAGRQSSHVSTYRRQRDGRPWRVLARGADDWRWTSLRMVERYAHLDDAELQRAVRLTHNHAEAPKQGGTKGDTATGTADAKSQKLEGEKA